MCLAIPAQVSVLLDDQHVAMVDIMGVRRKVSIDLLIDDPPVPGDWVLIHVGFAMSKISAQQAAEQLEALAILGEATSAQEEVDGYEFGSAEPQERS
jgi:hydrogenase expression/formation protein HypC